VVGEIRPRKRYHLESSPSFRGSSDGYLRARKRGAFMVGEPNTEQDPASDLRCSSCGRVFDTEADLRAHLEDERGDHPLAYPPDE
jgi:hypothetical protein